MNSLLSGLSSPMILNRGFETTRPLFRYPESAFRVTGRLLPTEPPDLAGIGGNAMQPTAPPQLMPPTDASGEDAFVPSPAAVPFAPNPASVAAAEGQMPSNRPRRLQALVARMKQAGNRMTNRMAPGVKALSQMDINRAWLQPVLDEKPVQTPVTSREYIPNNPYGQGRYA